VIAKSTKTRDRQRDYGARISLAVFVVLTEAAFLYFWASEGVAFILAGLLITFALLMQLRFGMRPNAAAPADIVVFIFNWLFLDFAQKLQLISAPRRLINTSTVSPVQVVMADLVCALFIGVYTLCYYLLSRRPAPTTRAALAEERPLSGFGIALAVVVCAVITVTVAPLTYHMNYTEEAAQDSPLMMVIRNVLVFLPSATLLIVLHETVHRGVRWTFSRGALLVLLFVLVLFTKNTHTDTRFLLGSVYLSIILVVFDTYFKSQNRRIVLLTLGMVLVFPLSALFTHHLDVTFESILNTIESHYFEPHYDSWANIYSAVEMVRRHGPEWGHQLLGTLLFFVPRSLWPTKPVHTGVFIANYLIANYRMWFTNLSAPLVAEGYIDFGAFGVALYACLLGMLVSLLNRVASLNSKWLYMPLATYISIYLMYASRGPLMAVLAYGLGTCFAFFLASTMLHIGHRSRYKSPASETQSLLRQ